MEVDIGQIGNGGKNMKTNPTMLKRLAHLEHTAINWSADSGGIVYRIYDTWILFEALQCGDNPLFVMTAQENDLDKLINTAYSWT